MCCSMPPVISCPGRPLLCLFPLSLVYNSSLPSLTASLHMVIHCYFLSEHRMLMKDLGALESRQERWCYVYFARQCLLSSVRFSSAGVGRERSENKFSGNLKCVTCGLGGLIMPLSSSFYFRSCPVLHPHRMLTALMATASMMR